MSAGRRVRLLDGEGRLRFEVTDDGAGFDPSPSSYGTGLQGITDRLAALGSMEVRSTPGGGTTLAEPSGRGLIERDSLRGAGWLRGATPT